MKVSRHDCYRDRSEGRPIHEHAYVNVFIHVYVLDILKDVCIKVFIFRSISIYKRMNKYICIYIHLKASRHDCYRDRSEGSSIHEYAYVYVFMYVYVLDILEDAYINVFIFRYIITYKSIYKSICIYKYIYTYISFSRYPDMTAIEIDQRAVAFLGEKLPGYRHI
jgi:hypothetical protein